MKHNFSVYFYMLYLTMDASFSWIISLLAFLPQLLLVVVFGVKHYKDLPFCCFVQTFAFVTFNKVCTSQVIHVKCLKAYFYSSPMLIEFVFVQFQYFLWYLSLLPLILHRVQISLTKALKMLFAWLTSQVTVQELVQFIRKNVQS